jgi:hypothetical protein
MDALDRVRWGVVTSSGSGSYNTVRCSRCNGMARCCGTTKPATSGAWLSSSSSFASGIDFTARA